MKKYLSLIVLTILFVACDSTNDFGTPFTKGQEVTLTAAIGEQRPQMLPGKQRVSGINAGEEINLTWDEGDKILIKVGDLSAEFTLSDGANTGEGTFTGIMPADGTSFSVQYPTFVPNLTEQQCVINGFGKDLMLMSTKEAGTLDGGFVLSADYALLGLQLTGNRKIGKIVLSRNNSAGKVGDESYTLLCPNVVLTAEPTLFYIVVLPGTWEKGFTVEVFASDNSVVIDKFVKTSSITFGTDNAIIMPEKHVQNSPKRIGVFSVGEGKYVSFSQGNLQYIQSTKTWQFAENQQEYIGAANVNGSALADKIDLFGWSSDSGKAPFGISTSSTPADYMGEFVDWGVNIIQGDKANTWRTLSVEEWGYLFKKRDNADKLYSKGSVDGLRGMIVLPDNWVLPEGLQFTANPNNLTMKLDINTYSREEWQRMEDAGAVFFCPTGRRDGTIIGHLDHYGCYWSGSRTADKIHTCHMYYNYSSEIFTTNYQSGEVSYGVNGRAVRLVHDTIVPEAVELGLPVKWAHCYPNDCPILKKVYT